MSAEITPASERKCTNIPPMIFCIIFLLVTVGLVTYCGIKGAKTNYTPEQQQTSNKDSCGNICGQRNFNNSSECGSLDKTNMIYLLKADSSDSSESITKVMEKSKLDLCVAECPSDYKVSEKTCIKNVESLDFFEDFSQAIGTSWIYILIISIVAFVFSYVFLVLFRHYATQVIWIINIGIIVLLFGIAIIFAFIGHLPGFILFGAIGLIMSIVLCCFHKRIAMVAKIFKEASKALTDTPGIMFEPIATLISLTITFVLYALFGSLVESVGQNDEVYPYAYCFNFVSFIFFIQFIVGCQNFVIAGTISRWYFTHDKTKLRTPIKKSFSHLFKFHLGSICAGALVITIVKLIRMLSKKKENRPTSSVGVFFDYCTSYLCEMIEKLLEYLVRNAYIIIAKDGTPFIKSGMRATKLLLAHIKDVVALNHFGDFVLAICRLLIVLIAGCVGYAVISQRTLADDEANFGPMIIGCIIAFLIAHCFVMVFEMTVDTIFICFCIDCEENDGVTRPYYMSEGLKKVMMEMKAQSGGTFEFGPKVYNAAPGMHDGSGMPMIPYDQQMQPMYPQVQPGFQPVYPPQEQPMMGYPQQPYMQQPYPQQPYQPTTYPIQNEKYENA